MKKRGMVRISIKEAGVDQEMKYRYEPQNDVSGKDRPHIRW
jgi:hypothetical protein